MVLNIPISQETEFHLRAKAAAEGLDVETYAARQLERLATRPVLSQISGNAAKTIEASGMTEDEVAELLEQEKHAMRSEKRTKSST